MAKTKRRLLNLDANGHAAHGDLAVVALII